MVPLLRAMHHQYPTAIEEEIELQDLDFSSYTLEWLARVPQLARLLPHARPARALRVHEEGAAGAHVPARPEPLGAEVAAAPRADPRAARDVPRRDVRDHAPRSGLGDPVGDHDARVRRPHAPRRDRARSARRVLGRSRRPAAARVRARPRPPARRPQRSTCCSTSSWPTTSRWSNGSTNATGSPMTPEARARARRVHGREPARQARPARVRPPRRLRPRSRRRSAPASATTSSASPSPWRTHERTAPHSRSSAAARSRTGTSTRSTARGVPITVTAAVDPDAANAQRDRRRAPAPRAYASLDRRARRAAASTPRSSRCRTTCTSRSRPRRCAPACTCCSRSRSHRRSTRATASSPRPRAAGTVFMVAENAQYWPEVLTVRDLIDDGAIGDVITARAATFFPALGDFYGGDRPWRFDRRGRGRRRGDRHRLALAATAARLARRGRRGRRRARPPASATWKASRCAARCCASSRARSPRSTRCSRPARSRTSRCSP